MIVSLPRVLLAMGLVLSVPSRLSAATDSTTLAALVTKAEAGNAIAQYNLGLVYADPDEPSHDPVQAFVWLSRAASSGSRSRELTLVSEQLTPAQLRQAQAQLGNVSMLSITPVGLEETTATPRPTAPTPTSRTPATVDPELRQRLAIAETALAVRERDIAKLAAELDAIKARDAANNRPDAVAEIQFLRTHLTTSQVETQAVRQELIDTRETLAATEQAQQNLATRLSHTQALLDASQQGRTSTADLHAQLASAQSSATELQAKLVEIIRAKEAALAEIKTLTALRDQQAGELNLAQAHIQQLRAISAQQSAEHQTELASLRERLAQTAPSSDSSASSPQIAHLESQLAEAKIHIARLDKSREQTSAENRALITELATTRVGIAQAQLRADAADTTIVQLESQITALNPALENTRDAAKSAQAEATKAVQELAQSQTQLAEAQAELDRVFLEFETFRSENTDQAEAVQSLTVANETLSAENTKLTDSIELLQGQLDVLTNEVIELRTSSSSLPGTSLIAAPPLPSRAAPVRPAPVNPRPSAPRTHTVATGESLILIAKHYLGSEDRWPEIFALNRETIGNANGVHRGMVLVIP